MSTVNADDVRIPRRVRDAVTRHERVLVLNRERPVMAIVHPEDLLDTGPRRRGRRVAEIASALAGAPAPDPRFGDDMHAVLADVGAVPEGPWDRS